MAFTFEQIFAADPANPSNIAQNASITIFAPGDGTMTPLAITDPDGQPLANPIPVNANGFGSAFAHATLDRVAWAGGGFTGFFTSYEGMKQEAIDARAAAETAAATAGADAAAVATAAIGTATDEATAAAAAAANSATAAANSAALVGAPADTAIAAAINGTGATKTALNATYGRVDRLTYAIGADRSVSNPGVLQFSPHFIPAGEEGDHYGVMMRHNGTRYVIQATPAKGNLSRVMPREPIFEIVGDNVYDPFLLRLPNGNILMGFHSGDEGSIYFYRSTDQGATWAVRAELNAGDPVATRQRYSEVMMIRATTGSAWTSTPNRIIAAWANIDPILPKSRDTYMVTAYSDDEGLTWSTPVRATPASGATSCGLLDDNQRPWLFEDDDAGISLVYTRVEVSGGVSVGSVWHTKLNNVGAPLDPETVPTKVTDAPLAKSSPSLTSGSKNGCSPAVFVARDGYYRLVWSEADYGNAGTTGQLRMMSGDGNPAGWSNKETLTNRTDCPNGYGRITPHRISGVMELLHVRTLSASATDIRSLTMPGL